MKALQNFGRKLKRVFCNLSSESLSELPSALPKKVQARVLNPNVAHGAPLKPRAVVRVVTGAPKDNWIKKI